VIPALFISPTGVAIARVSAAIFYQSGGGGGESERGECGGMHHTVHCLQQLLVISSIMFVCVCVDDHGRPALQHAVLLSSRLLVAWHLCHTLPSCMAFVPPTGYYQEAGHYLRMLLLPCTLASCCYYYSSCALHQSLRTLSLSSLSCYQSGLNT
jgi:hypothetical protein